MVFSVSVVIPVYNCGQFVEKAVRSALNEPEVVEVLIVNDGSTDSTNEILERLKLANNRVKVFYHKNKSNQGRSASRNLGIKHAIAEYIAFLDADDYYSKDRFKNDDLIFREKNNVDGVYNAIGVHFYRESTEEEKQRLKLCTIKEGIEPAMLFEALFYGGKGYFSIDGLTVKKSVFEKIGFFNEDLEVSEDTELFFKMALQCMLVSGILDKPVALRGVHETNVFNQKILYEANQQLMWESLIVWCSKRNIEPYKIDMILNRLWIIKFRNSEDIIINTSYWFALFSKSPKLLLSSLGVKYFPLIRLRKKVFPFLFST